MTMSLILLLIPLLSISAGTYPDDEIQNIYDSAHFSAFYEAVYNTETVAMIEREYTSLLKWIDETESDPAVRIITASRASMIFAKHLIIEEYCMDLEKAKMLLDRVLSDLDTIGEERRDIEYTLVLGESYGSYYLLDQKKYLLSYGMRSNTLTNDAWDTDSDNIRTILLKCNQLIYTPPLFGGDTKKARTLLLGIFHDPLLPVDRYNLYSMLGMIEKKQRHKDAARDYFEKAREIYPGNRYITTLMEGL